MTLTLIKRISVDIRVILFKSIIYSLQLKKLTFFENFARCSISFKEFRDK